MEMLMHWLRLTPGLTGKLSRKEVLESALNGDCLAGQPVERLLDHLGRTA